MLREKLESPIFIGNLFLAMGMIGAIGLLIVISHNIWIESTATKLTGTIVEVQTRRLGGGSSGRTYFSHIVELSQNGQTKRYKAEDDLGHSLRPGSTRILLTDDDKLYMHDHHAMYWTHLPKFLIIIPFIVIGLFIKKL